MASTIDKIKSDLLETISASQRKTSAYDTEAEVVRIEGNTAWVHIGGGVAETPVQLTINAQKGDKVQVRVSNEGAWIMGNATAPPTDDTKAEEAQEKIAETKTVVEKVKIVAENAQKIAGNTNQYFWHTQEGTDTGAHITEIPQEEFLADPSNGGGNLLARSNGISVRNGLTELASFGANGATIGISDGTESYLSLDYHSLQLIDREGTTYFYVSDLRDADGYAEITEYFTADGVYKIYTLQYAIQSPTGYSPTATVDGVADTYTFYGNVLTLTNLPAAGSAVKIVYKTKNQLVKAYTFGIRKTGETIGAMSIAEGYQTIASGICSHAEGYNTEAEGHYCHAEGNHTVASYGDGSHAEGSHSEAQGSCSHAEGKYTVASDAYSHSQNYYTIAAKQAQTALGTYNEEDTSNQTTHPSNILDYGQFAVIIGNGTADNARSNALMVDWNGDIYPRATKMTDFVVDEGTSGNWTYRKWKSGKSECWGLIDSSSRAMTSAEGSGYYAAQTTYTYPTGLFTGSPVTTIGAHLAGSLGNFSISYNSSTELKGYWWATKSTTKKVYLYAHAIGTWT